MPAQVAEHSTPEERLRAAGLRVTAPRLGVLNALETEPHADADTVARHVRASLGTVSTQAVYDVLHALTDAGLLRRIEPAGSPALYETRVGDNHHHLVCRSCGVVVDVECSGAAVPCLIPEPRHGFTIDEAEVTFWGLCPTCTDEMNKENA
ncbi:transcriptional repressor [Phytoactinopolyspora alkaliphila]|uniref:Transcriptional repressor n=1 Tax=Phytoactinopolyspora alkaliphila TaxID=1783498 RepID=A0A6N9YHR5_9ACTN|nr:Fur family transcriptional regulator [Phytoactinopolyspora alkaliphila]NED94543.1 transcriptional repressor [Phytoactinopolyspora alkaliphila]